MDIQAIISQVSAALADAPERLQDLLADPKGTIEELTGQPIGDADLSQIVDGVKSGIADGSLDLGALDLGNLDLGALDLGNLDLGALAGGLGGMLGGLGGLFGRK